MLPKINVPTFKVKVPSLEREILMRPFLVKEEKILLLAKQSQDKEQIFLSLNQVVQGCIVDEEIDVLKLPYYDIEYLFVQLRINSIGGSVEVEINDPDTEKKVKASIELADIQIKAPKSKNSIKINDTTALIMKYPTLDEISKVSTENDVDSFFDTLKYSIKAVFHEDENYEFGNYSDEEKTDFIDSLSVTDIDKCREFISKMPTVEVEAKWVNSEGTNKSTKLKGINSFF